MNKLVFGLASIPLFVGIAAAAEPMTDVQMDQITAGDLPMIVCPTCLSSSSTTTSMTTNGITVMTSIGGTTGGSTGGSGGSTGGSGGSTGGSGGTTGGTTPAPPAPIVTLPSNLVSIITVTTGFGPMLH